MSQNAFCLASFFQTKYMGLNDLSFFAPHFKISNQSPFKHFTSRPAEKSITSRDVKHHFTSRLRLHPSAKPTFDQAKMCNFLFEINWVLFYCFRKLKYPNPF